MAHNPTSQLPHPHQDSGHEGHSEPHASSATYFAIFIALLVLTAISFGIGMSLGSLPKWIANLAMVTVSCAKAMLVILFFMHVLFEANWKYVLTIPAAGMSLFLVGVLYFEFHDRTRYYSEERLIHTAEALSLPHAEHGAGEHGSGTIDHGAATEHGAASEAGPAAGTTGAPTPAPAAAESR